MQLKFIAVDVFTDAKFGSNPDLLLKTDIEGSEYDVFDQAGDEALWRIAKIVCEWHGMLRLWQPEFRDRA